MDFGITDLIIIKSCLIREKTQLENEANDIKRTSAHTYTASIANNLWWENLQRQAAVNEVLEKVDSQIEKLANKL